MKTLTQQLTQYAAYHRDKRNIFSHFIGIPLITLSVSILLSRPDFSVFGFTTNPATVLVLLMSLYYLKLDTQLGIAMVAFMGATLWIGAIVAASSTVSWLITGIAMFIIGWVIQFVGHLYERRKPAFFDDVVGLAIGPLFVMAEFAFLLGLRTDLKEAIEDQVGPAVIKMPLPNT